jgi:hypothetical protein
MRNVGVANKVAQKVEEFYDIVSRCQQALGGVYVWFDSRGSRICVNHEPDETLFTVDVEEHEIGSAEFEVVSRLKTMGVNCYTDYYDFEDKWIELKTPSEKVA